MTVQIVVGIVLVAISVQYKSKLEYWVSGPLTIFIFYNINMNKYAYKLSYFNIEDSMCLIHIF